MRSFPQPDLSKHMHGHSSEPHSQAKHNGKLYTISRQQIYDPTMGITAHGSPFYTRQTGACMVSEFLWLITSQPSFSSNTSQTDQRLQNHLSVYAVGASSGALHGCIWIMVWAVHLDLHIGATICVFSIDAQFGSMLLRLWERTTGTVKIQEVIRTMERNSNEDNNLRWGRDLS
jgi:hypothetical protein